MSEHLYQLGTIVFLKNGTIEAIIVRIMIQETSVQYECAWWWGNDRKKEWFNEFEFTTKAKKSARLGFRESALS